MDEKKHKKSNRIYKEMNIKSKSKLPSSRQLKNEKRELVKFDLLRQLEDSNRFQKFYVNLIDDYMIYYDIKNRLQNDIKSRGLIITVTTGNGFKQKKTNESVKELRETSRIMLKILQDLKIQEPSMEKNDFDESDFT